MSESGIAALISAGGIGSRMRPLTADCPKPLLPIGGSPILELLIQNLASCGISDVFISIRYLGQQIMDYFGNGEQFGVKIKYIHEDHPLGTAGALSYFPADQFDRVILVNGDIYAEVDYAELAFAHLKSRSSATICVKRRREKLPYGLVVARNDRFERIDEKPVQSLLLNAGIYVFETNLITHISRGETLDAPDFLNHLANQGHTIGIYELFGYWFDLGDKTQLQTVRKQFAQNWNADAGL